MSAAKDTRADEATALLATGELSRHSGSKISWQKYLEAALGFRNHWYPVAFSGELNEGKTLAVMVAGEKVILNRSGGQVWAVEDRCAHRGVPFSNEPLCLRKGTISCWYHGWTYDMSNGRLCDILAAPSSPIIGKVAIRAYRVTEAKGMAFLYLGDGDAPPLADDTAPGFLDDGTEALGIRREVMANWRLGVENGFDPAHVLIHRNSILIKEERIALPYAFAPSGKRANPVVVTDGWPKGLYDNLTENYTPMFEAKINGETVMSFQFTGQEKMLIPKISIWLPGMLKVDPWPTFGLISYEWYVPMDEYRHQYFQLVSKPISSPAEMEQFQQEFREKWVPIALHGFNDDDIRARENMEPFYRQQGGWSHERLFGPDFTITEWRRLASQYNRGIQTAEQAMHPQRRNP